MLGEYTVKDNVRVVLSAGITSAATSITVTNGAGMFHTPPDPTGDTASNGFAIATLVDSIVNPTVTEIVTYKSVTDNGNGTSTLGTVARAQFSTTASAFSSGAYLIQSHTSAQNKHGSVTYNKATNTLTAVNVVASGTLGVTGASTLAAVSATTVATTGNATIGGTLGVTGTSTFAAINATSVINTGNGTVGGTFGVTGATTLGTTSTGQLTASTVHATSNAQVDGTLAVTGTTTLGNVTASGTLGVTGQATIGSAYISATLALGNSSLQPMANAITPNVQMLGTTLPSSSATAGIYSADTNPPLFYFLKSRGASVGTLATVASGDSLGQVSFHSVNSSNALVSSGYYRAVATAAPGTNVPLQHQWSAATASAAQSTVMTLDATNGLNVTGTISLGGTLVPSGFTPSAWQSGTGVLAAEASTSSLLLYSNYSAHLNCNAFFDGLWRYKGTTAAANTSVSNSTGLTFNYAASGTAGAALTWVQKFNVDTNGNATFAGQVAAKNFGTPSAAFTFTSNATTVDWTTTAHATITLPNTATTQTIHFTAPANPGTLRLKLTPPATGTCPSLTFDAGVASFPMNAGTNYPIYPGGGYVIWELYFDGANYTSVNCFMNGDKVTAVTSLSTSQLQFGSAPADYWSMSSFSAGYAALSGTLGQSFEFLNSGEMLCRGYGVMQNSVTEAGNAATANFTKGQNNITLVSSATCTLTFTAPTNPGFVALNFIAPASGTSPTLAFPATVTGGPSTTALGLSKKRTLIFYFDGNKYLYFNSSGDY